MIIRPLTTPLLAGVTVQEVPSFHQILNLFLNSILHGSWVVHQADGSTDGSKDQRRTALPMKLPTLQDSHVTIARYNTLLNGTQLTEFSNSTDRALPRQLLI